MQSYRRRGKKIKKIGIDCVHKQVDFSVNRFLVDADDTRQSHSIFSRHAI